MILAAAAVLLIFALGSCVDPLMYDIAGTKWEDSHTYPGVVQVLEFTSATAGKYTYTSSTVTRVDNFTYTYYKSIGRLTFENGSYQEFTVDKDKYLRTENSIGTGLGYYTKK
jgi:hypothetical protein